MSVVLSCIKAHRFKHTTSAASFCTQPVGVLLAWRLIFEKRYPKPPMSLIRRKAGTIVRRRTPPLDNEHVMKTWCL